MPAPYYTGDNVPLVFTVTDDDGAVVPTAVDLQISKPDGTVPDIEDAVIDGNEVSYTVTTGTTDMAGGYKAFFVLTLPNGNIRTHQVSFSVVANPS